MNVGKLTAEIDRAITGGAAPGCSVALSTGKDMALFSLGRFAGPGSLPADNDTVYDVASITKLFTTALMLQLHTRGLVNVYDRVGNYLPTFSDSQITLLNLLTHQVELGISFATYREQYPTKDALLAALAHHTPPALPARGTHYANAQFTYLGQIIEKVTGESLAVNMKRLLKDLELSNTFVGSEITRLEVATPPTEITDGQLIQGVTHDETARLLGGLAGHAGIFSTAEDLMKFGRAWLDGKVADKDILDELAFRNYDPTNIQPQALGWWLRCKSPDGERITPGIYSHTGFTGPLLIINPAKSKVAAITCNRTYYGRYNTKHRQLWAALMAWAS